MKRMTQRFQIGDSEVTATSDVFDGEKLDTKIEINGILFCWISGDKVKEFLEKLFDIVKEYRI